MQRMKSIVATLMLIGTVLLAACAGASGTPPAPGASVGGNQDTHGCLSSAGYSWCARTNRCERPWELAQKEGFAAEGFSTYCGAGARQ